MKENINPLLLCASSLLPSLSMVNYSYQRQTHHSISPRCAAATMPVNVSLLNVAPSFPPLVSIHWSETRAQYGENVETEIQESTDNCDWFFMGCRLNLNA